MNLTIKNRTGSFFKKVSSSERGQRFFFALVSGLLIILFVKIPIEKFKIEAGERIIPEHKEYYAFSGDYDEDGNSELFLCRNDENSKRFTLNVYDYRNSIIETTSFEGLDWNNDLVPAIFDIDGNKIKDFVFISLLNDSVFLHAINLKNFKPLFQPVLVGAIERKVNKKAYRSQFFYFGDKDKNGKNELYFFFDAGFGLNPRGMFRYDFEENMLYKTPKAYIAWLSPVFADINADGKEELLASNYAPNNVPFEAMYSDDRPYIGAFNLKMDYLFQPIPMGKGYGSVTAMPAVFTDTMFLALNTNLSSKSDSLLLFLLDYMGNILEKASITDKEESIANSFLKIIDNKNYLFIKGFEKIALTADLNHISRDLKKTGNTSEFFDSYLSWDIDADNDGCMDKMSFYSENSSFKIKNVKRNENTTFTLTTHEAVISVFPFKISNKVEKLLVTTTNGYFFLSYTENKNYWVKYLIWVGIFLTTFIITFLIQFAQRRRMEAKWASEKQLTELQFNTIRNQLNPHFIFNALNSVGYLIENGKKEEAYDYLSINARMIRKVLEDAELTTRTLEEEIQFVKDYLAIQEFRFKERFETIFKISNEVNLQLAVPKMVLHTYVENAVKHGFRNTTSGGLLEIIIEPVLRGVLLIILDNGKPALDQLVDHSESTGKGIKIMESYYRLFEKQYNCKIETSYIAKSELNKGETGFEVKIRIEF